MTFSIGKIMHLSYPASIISEKPLKSKDKEVSDWIPVEDFDAENTGCMTSRNYPVVEEPIDDEIGLSSRAIFYSLQCSFCIMGPK